MSSAWMAPGVVRSVRAHVDLGCRLGPAAIRAGFEWRLPCDMGSASVQSKSDRCCGRPGVGAASPRSRCPGCVAPRCVAAYRGGSVLTSLGMRAKDEKCAPHRGSGVTLSETCAEGRRMRAAAR